MDAAGKNPFSFEMTLNISPSEAIFPSTGGYTIHTISSQADTRHAFKVKSSNNEDYRVRPVYGFVNGQESVELVISRSTGAPRKDKLVIQWAEVGPYETDPKAPFEADGEEGQLVMIMRAE